MNISENTKIPFGSHKNTKIRDLPDNYLEWGAKKFMGTDFHSWSVAFQKEIQKRQDENSSTKGLEEQADELLRRAGYNPKNL